MWHTVGRWSRLEAIFLILTRRPNQKTSGRVSIIKFRLKNTVCVRNHFNRESGRLATLCQSTLPLTTHDIPSPSSPKRICDPTCHLPRAIFFVFKKKIFICQIIQVEQEASTRPRALLLSHFHKRLYFYTSIYYYLILFAWRSSPHLRSYSLISFSAVFISLTPL